jgi:arylsulfatase A-like enzyme
MSATYPAESPTIVVKLGEIPPPARRLSPLDVLVLSAWSGLAAGWLEVATRVLMKSIFDPGRMYLMSRQFVWLVPLSNLLLFFVVGLFLAAATKMWPRWAGWLVPRLICVAALMPALMVAVPRVYPWALLVLAAGIAIRVGPWLERPPNLWRRCLAWSTPALLGLVLVVAGFLFGGDWLKRTREANRALPRAGAPNVLLVVLDTVRADRMSLHGYPRATTPSLKRLAERGIRFDEARPTAPWTLPSHASIFTGRLPHEMSVNWKSSLNHGFPTLAEYLGSHGYATAGFVANTQYCSYDTGLDRGFTRYDDYIADAGHLRPLRTALLFQRAWDGISRLALMLPNSRYGSVFRWFLATDRKDAGLINREFVTWLYYRQDQRRPFFAFLNYYDAHAPYLRPEGTRSRFGPGPRSLTDFLVLVEQWKEIDKLKVSQDFVDLIQDSYDNCLFYLDARLGQLFEALENGGVLDHTVVIITADHGEELGEHDLFEHGESLYRPEVHVPLLFLLPTGKGAPRVVTETVSLRDLPATIVDLAGLADGSPFPGRSLARFWGGSGESRSPSTHDREPDIAVSELFEPNPTNPSRGRSPAVHGPLVSAARDGYVYIRNEGDGKEELFHERDDPRELVNLAGVEAMQPLLRRFRQGLDNAMAGSARAAPRGP